MAYASKKIIFVKKSKRQKNPMCVCFLPTKKNSGVSFRSKKIPVCVCFLPTQKYGFFNTTHIAGGGRSKQCVRIHEKNITQRASGPVKKLSSKHIGFPSQKKKRNFPFKTVTLSGLFRN